MTKSLFTNRMFSASDLSFAMAFRPGKDLLWGIFSVLKESGKGEQSFKKLAINPPAYIQAPVRHSSQGELL